MITAPIDGLGKYAPTPKGQTPQASETAPPEVKLPETGPVPPPEDRVEVTPEAVVQNVQQVPEAQVEATPQEQMVERISEIIAEAQSRTTSVAFRVDIENGDVIVRIVNRESGDVIREIPPAEIRNMQDKLHELRGMLISEVT